jgi:DNA-binding NtrC family response regulator
VLILVVDDEVQVTRSIARLLRRHGHEVRTAGSAEEALGMLDGVELLLTDVRMAGASGLELAAQVKRLHPTLRCCVMSGDVGAEGMQPSAPNVDGRIAKPFSHEALLGLIGGKGSPSDARKAGS